MHSSAIPVDSSVRRRRLPRLIAASLAVGLVVAWGADRHPADPTKPVVWRDNAYDSFPAETLRIASYNIHAGKGTDRRLNLHRIAEDLRDVDLAGLYEVQSPPWSVTIDQAFDLGDWLQLGSLFLPTERRWWHDHFGNAVLAKRPVPAVQRIPLVGTRGKAFRQAVLLDVPLSGKNVHIVMTHIDREHDREQQLTAVIRLFLALEAPSVLMGDLNSGPDDPQVQRLLSQDGVQNPLAAIPGDAEVQDNIDWIITRGLLCENVVYRHTGASDHPVVKATLRLP